MDIQVSQSCGSLSGRPTRVLPHREIRGNLWGLTTGDQVVMEKGVKLAVTSTQILTELISTCRGTQRKIPNNGFMPLCRSKMVTPLNRETGVQFLLTLEPILLLHPDKEVN